MLRAINRRAANIFGRRKKKKTQVYSTPRPPRVPSENSFGSWDRCSRPTDPVPHCVFEGTSFRESNEEEPDHGQCAQATGADDSTNRKDSPAVPTEPKHTSAGRNQAEEKGFDAATAESRLREREWTKIIEINHGNRPRQALLLSATTFERMQAMRDIRQQLHVLETQIATETKKLEEVKSDMQIEIQAERVMPGAYAQVEDNDEAEASRRRVMSAFQKQMRVESPACERLKARRRTSMIELQRLERLVLESIHEAVLDRDAE